MDREERPELPLVEHGERPRAFGAAALEHHRAQPVAAPLRDHEDDLRLLRIGRNLDASVDAYVDETTVLVVGVEFGDVVDQAIFVELALHEEWDRGARVDLRGEFVRRERRVADEEQFLHLDARAFDDAQDEDARVLEARLVDGDLGEVVAPLAVQLLDAVDRLLEEEVVARPACVERDRLAQFLIGDQLVADDLKVAHDRLLDHGVDEFDRAIGKHGRRGVDGVELAEAVERGDIGAHGGRLERLAGGDTDVVQDLALGDPREADERDLRDRPVCERLVVDSSGLGERC